MIIIFALLLIALLLVLFYFYRNNNFVANKFANNNVITFGVKGSGKDLLTQLAINKRKTPYYATIPYGGDYSPITVKELTVEPNTHDYMVLDQIVQIKKDHNREGVDCYISDGGIYLPSHLDTQLTKAYPSFPIYYALSRHLYNSNIHINTQALNRIWVKLREQADHYFMARGVIKIFGLLFIKVRYYSEYSSAEQHKLPMAKDVTFQNLGFGNKFNRALKLQFEAENGIIKDFICCIRVKNVHYDTRVFHEKIFGMKYLPRGH